MPDLLRQLEVWRGRRLWLLGVGSLEQGDDGFGVRLAKALQARLHATRAPVKVVNAGLCPERYVGLAAHLGCEELVFADAADFGAPSGSLLLASAAELAARRVAAFAHRVPLSVLAQYAEALGLRAWLLGVQPGSLRLGEGLSPKVAAAVESLAELLSAALFHRRNPPEVAP